MIGSFVTGGTGFVGGEVLRQVAMTPDLGPVRALARDRTGGETVRSHGAEPVMGDVLEPDTLVAGMEGCEYVFHAAGVVEFCRRDPAAMFAVNVTGTENVVAAAARAGVRRVVITSSAVALGEERGSVGHEKTRHCGTYLAAYEQSKHYAERAAFAAGERLGVEVVAVNPSSVHGPGRSTGTARLLIAYLDGRVPVAVDTRVSIVDVADCGRGHVAAARFGEPGERYVLSAPWVTARHLEDLLADITGRRRRALHVPRPVAVLGAAVAGGIAQVLGRDPPICREMMRVLLHGHAYDGSRATAELGLEYTPLRATLTRTVGWLVDFGFVRRRLPNFERG